MNLGKIFTWGLVVAAVAYSGGIFKFAFFGPVGGFLLDNARKFVSYIKG